MKVIRQRTLFIHIELYSTVCRSRLKRIRATKPDPIPNGARLTRAKNFPIISPTKQNILKMHRFKDNKYCGYVSPARRQAKQPDELINKLNIGTSYLLDILLVLR